MDITKDIRPLTEFERDTARFLSRLKETGRPSALTVNGKPELVVSTSLTKEYARDQETIGRQRKIQRWRSAYPDCRCHGKDASVRSSGLDYPIRLSQLRLCELRNPSGCSTSP